MVQILLLRTVANAFLYEIGRSMLFNLTAGGTLKVDPSVPSGLG